MIGCDDYQEAKKSESIGVEVTVQSRYGAGFFAEFVTVLSNIVYFDKKSNFQRLVVDWSQQFFPYKDSPTENGWDLYFDLIKANAPQNPDFIQHGLPVCHLVHDQTCMDRWVNYDKYLAYRQIFNQKMNEYLKIKQPILDEVEEFYKSKMQDHFCIGVHVRFSSAHTSENPGLLNLKDYINEARILLQKNSDKNPIIFVCSDSNYVINEFKKNFKSNQVVYTDARRAEFREEPHLIWDNPDYYLANPHVFHEKKPGYIGGKMTLIDCVLLSRCFVMVHSHSNVCEVATFFNPYIKSVFLPKGLSTSPCMYSNAPYHFKKLMLQSNKDSLGIEDFCYNCQICAND